MRAMRTDGKLKLEQELVSRQTLAVTGAAELSANLAEFAGPIRQYDRTSRIALQHELVRAVGAIEASADKPAARELVIARDVVSKRRRGAIGFTQPAPDEL